MTHAFRTLALSAICAALLTACAGASDQYPSLAIRDAERQVGQFAIAAPSTPPPPQTPAAQTAPQAFTQLRGAVEQARTAHQEFITQRADAERLAQSLRGLGAEDDRRARALVAVAALTNLHGQTALALSDLDNLEFIAASTFEATDDIKAAQILVSEMIAQQDAALDSLSVRLTR